MTGGGVGEMLVSAVVKEVLGKLSSAMWEQIGLVWNFKDDMKSMKKDLEMVGAVLGDAEKKSVTERSVCLWLKELKSAAYDIEDMMCNFETKIPPNNKEGDGWSRKLGQILSAPKVVKKRFVLANEMKRMRKRLGEIAKRRSDFGLSTTGSCFDKELVIKGRRTASKILVGTEILGREKEMDELVSLLLKSDSQEDVSIIAIVGLGGIGKTTLAQLIYNDQSVKQAFNRHAWAYVSMEFDLKNIGTALLESLGESSQNASSTLEGTCANLEKKIKGTKFFIVLDDLWEQDGIKLENLMGILRGGSKGSKILVTTRSENVAIRIRATQSHKIEVLSDDHCWSLFSERAFTSGNVKNNDLVEIGKEIVKKCGGIPLAAKSLGYTMQLKNGIDAWVEVRDSDIWKLKEQSDNLSETGVLASLKLSYYFMPSYLKLCFGYCSIFPKGCRIIKDELIQQWIALGFIQPMHNGLSLEKRGDEYVNDFLNMSFLQLKGKTILGMHDLVHDLARSIIRDELLILDAENYAPYYDEENDYRYASVLNFMDLKEVCQTLPRKIRALHFDNGLGMAILCFPNHAFSHLKYIRVLHLYEPPTTEFLTSIRKLKQLRYLRAQSIELEVLSEHFRNLRNLRYMDISNSMCKKLPESFVNLTNLRVLKLNGCSKLENFPENLSFVSLQELYLSGCKSLMKPPKYSCNQTSIGKLDMMDQYYPPFLDNMHDIVLIKKNNFIHYDIVEFSKVDASKITSHSLEIAFLENVIHPEDASKANLCTKSDLKSVKYKWAYQKERTLEEMAHDSIVLENLKPHDGLDNLIIDGYSAPKFPYWLSNIECFLSNISSLHLENMKICEDLPSLGLLRNLNSLTIRNIPMLKKINKAFFGVSREPFRRLRTLVLDRLLELRKWPTKLPNSKDEYVFTQLERLEVCNCPKLRFTPSFPGSQNCYIKRSPYVLIWKACQRSTSLATRELTIESYVLQWRTLPNIIQGMTSLRKLRIHGHNYLILLPDWLKEVPLEELWVDECKSLEYLPLSLLDLPSIKSIRLLVCNKTLVEWCSRDSRFHIIGQDYYRDIYWWSPLHNSLSCSLSPSMDGPHPRSFVEAAIRQIIREEVAKIIQDPNKGS